MSIFIPRQIFADTLFTKHFPPEIAMRFTVLKDSQIYKASEDEGTWNRQRAGNENWHIMFDMVEIMEIVQTQRLSNQVIEIIFLRNFADAIRSGTISLSIRPDLVTAEESKKSAKRAKEIKANRRHMDVIESFKYAQDHPMGVEEANVTIQKIQTDQNKTISKKFKSYKIKN